MTYFAVLYILASAALISGADTNDVTSDITTKCLRTLDEFQDSLLSRKVNLNSLQVALLPPNRQKSISIVVKYYFCDQFNNGSFPTCNDLVRYVGDIDSGRVPEVNYSGNYSFKFGWHASPINLFIRPQLLSPLSLYIYRVDIPTAHIILDRVCEDMLPLDQRAPEQDSDDPDKVCNNVSSTLKLLNQVTPDLKSLFMAQRMTIRDEHRYSVWFFDPKIHADDFCVLEQTRPYSHYRMILAAAILLTQVLNIILIPFFAHSFYKSITKKLYDDDDSKTAKHYFGGFTFTIFLMGILVFISDLYLTTVEMEPLKRSVFGDVLLFYHIGLAFLLTFPFGLNLIIMVINIIYLIKVKSSWCKALLFGPTVFVYVFAAELFSFHIVYVVLGFFAAPVETCSLLSLYLTMVFLFTMSCALVSKSTGYVYNRRARARKCSLCCSVTTVFFCIIIIFLPSMVCYLLFYYMMVIAIEPYGSQGILLAVVGSLLPSIFNIGTGILQKQLIKFLSRIPLMAAAAAEEVQPQPVTPDTPPAEVQPQPVTPDTPPAPQPVTPDTAAAEVQPQVTQTTPLLRVRSGSVKIQHGVRRNRTSNYQSI